MDPELSAKATITLFVAVSAVVLLWQALHWPDGWRAWMLSVVNRFYLYSCFHLRTNRVCPFPDQGPAIIIANHSSPLDPMFIWLGRKRSIGFMMAKEFYEVRSIHWIFKSMQSIPVERNGKDLVATRTALRRLKSGELLGVFPEGRINRETDLLPANTGVAWLALNSQAPVYPVYIQNSPGGKNMVEPFYHFCRVRLNYGKKIDLSEYYGQKKTRELLHTVTDLLMSRVAELGEVGWRNCVFDEPPETHEPEQSTVLTAERE